VLGLARSVGKPGLGLVMLTKSTTIRSTARPAAIVLLALAVALAACGGSDDPPDRPDPTDPTPTTQSPEAEVEAAYLAYWDMVVRLTAAPASDASEVTDRAAEPMRGRFIDSLDALNDAGQAIHTGSRHEHDVSDIAIEGDSAHLRDCGVDDSAVIDESSGALVQEKLTTELLEVDLVRGGADWRVQNIVRVDSWDGKVPCDG
jgi:hypothetical protein